MQSGPEETPHERMSTVWRLLDSAERAHALARGLNEELVRITAWDTNSGVGPLRYSLGICLGDAESSASRLAGLRNELQVIARMLEQQHENRREA